MQLRLKCINDKHNRASRGLYVNADTNTGDKTRNTHLDKIKQDKMYLTSVTMQTKTLVQVRLTDMIR